MVPIYEKLIRTYSRSERRGKEGNHAYVANKTVSTLVPAW